VLVVNKPVGPTSHDVVATARRALRLRRIGHTGTLDPLASGVLPLVLGAGTRLAKYLTASQKEYEATLRFGIETDSYDSAGQITRETGEVPSHDAVVAALQRFGGTFTQRPPIYSAKKMDGDRAYERARNAQPVVLEAVPVTVHAIELVAFTPPRAQLRVICSAGFYVRSLAHDIGVAVETGAVLEALVRRRAGGFGLEEAISLSDLATDTLDSLAAKVVPMEHLLSEWPSVQLNAHGMRKVAHGRELDPSDWVGAGAGAEDVRLLAPDGRLVGLAKPSKTAGFLHPAVVFSYN
jgi:tRNA pseudouridine55 synthase